MDYTQYDKLPSILSYYQQYHSKFQIEKFIIQRQGHPFAQLKQVAREIHRRIESITSLEFALQRSDLERQHLMVKIDLLAEEQDIDKNFERANLMLDLEEKGLQTIKTQESLQETKRELNILYEIGQQIENDLRKIYPDMTEEVMQRLEIEAWEDKVQEMAFLDFVTSNRLQRPTLELLQAWEQPYQQQILGKMQQKYTLPVTQKQNVLNKISS